MFEFTNDLVGTSSVLFNLTRSSMFSIMPSDAVPPFFGTGWFGNGTPASDDAIIPSDRLVQLIYILKMWVS
jgi:hypothetical protein